MKNSIQLPQWQGSLGGQLPQSLIILILALPASLALGLVIGHYSPPYGVAAASALLMIIIVLLRLDALTVTFIIAAHLFVDWYMGLHIVAILMALALLFAYYFGRTEEHPWVGPRAPWLWALFLALTIYPAINGGQFSLYDLATYYPNDIVGALLFFWLGNIIAKDINAVRRIFQFLAALGSLIALHTIIESRTGVFLFASSRVDTYLVEVSNYDIIGTNAFRVGSFFFDPNWNGTFLAMMLFLPLGLFIETRTVLAKLLYFIEISIILPALLFTYSTGAFVGCFAGVLAYVLWVGRTRYRVLLISIIALAAFFIFIVFPSQIAVELQHANGPNELLLRLAVWQTGLQVIQAFPLFGVGLGYQAYLLRSNPYRSPGQFMPLAHPHDSYIEWGAMAGIPVLIVFLLLLAVAFWYAGRNWLRAEIHIRPLLGAGLAVLTVLTINSISINGWTLPPLEDCGWFIAGLISSSLLARYLSQRTRTLSKDMSKQVSITDYIQTEGENTL